MALNFRQVHQQVKQFGKEAQQRERWLQERRNHASQLLDDHATEGITLREKVAQVVRDIDPSLRCALPANEPLNQHSPSPTNPIACTLIAADGSQIYLDHHAATEYFLINIGAICVQIGSGKAPETFVESDLYYGNRLEELAEYPGEEQVALLRDLRERQILAKLAQDAKTPVISLTDGPLELWGTKSPTAGKKSTRSQSREAFLETLAAQANMGAITAGYIDKPSEDYVVRLLEIASSPPDKAGKQRPLRGVRDRDIFGMRLAPGERSAVFEIQSRSAKIYKRYKSQLSLFFFYLNVGRPRSPWITRVDTLAWVINDSLRLDALHATIIHQCEKLGTHPYPYVLHRAHETAVVTREDKEQLDSLIAAELRKYGLRGTESHKQGLKALPGKGRYNQ